MEGPQRHYKQLSRVKQHACALCHERDWLRPYQQGHARLIPVGYPWSRDAKSQCRSTVDHTKPQLIDLVVDMNFFWVADRLFLVILRKLTSLFVESKFSPREKKASAE